MATLTTLQEMFLVSYSILFGIMLNTCMGLGLFFFGWIWDKNGSFNKEPLIRALASLFFINFIPFVYFALIYDWLGTITNDPTFFQIIGTFQLSLFVFGIYRVFHLIIKVFKDKLYGKEILEEEYQGVEDRLNAIGPSVKGQMVSVIIYVLIALLGAYWIKGNQAFHDLIGWFILIFDP